MSGQLEMRKGYRFPEEKKLGSRSEIRVPKSLEDGMELAKDTEDEVKAYGEDILRAINDAFGKSKCEFKFNLKKEKRARQKLADKYEGDLSRMEDLARCRISCDTIEQMNFIKKYIAMTADTVRMEDRLQEPNQRGYRDLKYTLVASNGLKFEMQINVHELVDAGKRAHVPYEKIRDITGRTKDRELTKEEKREIKLLEEQCRYFYARGVAAYNRRTKGEKLKVQTVHDGTRARKARNDGKTNKASKKGNNIQRQNMRGGRGGRG